MTLPICDDSWENQRLENFLKNWPLSRVRTMPLTDYTRVNNNGANDYKESFCYALERLTPVGIGGANSLKFQIYEFKNESKIKRTNTDGRYVWHVKLGASAEIAYTKIRELITEVIDSAQAGNYEAIDSIELVSTLKWKIAFLYQNQKNPGIVGCVSEEGLKQFFEDRGEDIKNLKVSQLHAKAINEIDNQASMHAIGRVIWNTVKEMNSKPDDLEFNDKVEEPKSDYNKQFISIRECNRLTASPYAYHWLYKITPESGDNSFSKRKQNGNIAMNYLPQEDYRSIKPNDDNTNRNWEEGMAQLFATGMQINDIVYAYDSTSKTIEGIGIVTGDYEFQNLATDSWKHTRKVYWIPLVKTVRTDVGGLSNKQLTGMLFDPETDKNDFRYFIKETLTLAGLDIPSFMPKLNRSPISNPPAQLKGPLLESWSKNISEKKKPTIKILYGPPGTGKTYSTTQEVVQICLGKTSANFSAKEFITELKLRGNVEFVTFHQNYDYSDFIEGYRPHTNENGQMSYRLEDGVLKRIAKKAINRPDQPFILIIDEINRGNISKIFGELITLIEADKRIGEENETRVNLPYSHESFCLPSNLSIIGTMNTSDRSIAVLDTALRRRFDFKRMDPDTKVLDKEIPGCGTMLEKFNKLLRSDEYKRTSDQQIGHAWFWDAGKKAPNSDKKVLDETALGVVFMNKILPLLEEWFFGEEDKLEQIVKTFCKGYPESDKMSYLDDNEWVKIIKENK